MARTEPATAGAQSAGQPNMAAPILDAQGDAPASRRRTRTAPVEIRSEIDSREFTARELPVIDDVDDLADDVVLTEEELARGYAEELAFQEELVTIRIHRGREKYAPTTVDLHVNGKSIWVPVERDVRIKRKFVEVLARAQPIDVRTESGAIEGDEGAATINKVHRSQTPNYAFSVLGAQSARERQWLDSLIRVN